MTNTQEVKSDFVPLNIDASKWEIIEPYFQQLLDRELACENCLEQLLLDRSELDAAVSEAQANLYINMTCHTDDEECKNAYLAFVEHVEPEVKRIGFELDKKIVQSPHAGKLDQTRYEVLLRNLKADVEIFRDENVPLQTEDTKLDQQYSEACGAMVVEFRGEEKTLPQMNKYLEENDRQTREDAWRLVANRRQQEETLFNGIFDEMIKLRHEISRNADFDTYVDYAFRSKHRFDYTPDDCSAFHDAVENVCVPLSRSLNRQRAEALGDDQLRPWDLEVDVRGREPLVPFSGADELIDRTSKVFHRMDKQLGGLYDRMREGHCLDLETRQGKAPGGYQYQRDRTRRPFIFMNAAGIQRDLETMVHEAGHAFHSMLCDDEPLVAYRHSPLEFAEVASMSMELLTYPYLDEFYGEDEIDRAKRKHLEGIVKILPWIATIDAFQHWLYTHPDHNHDERTEYWLELDHRFGPEVSWLDLEDLRKIQWQRQLHLFSVPFYYIEYGIAQLGALQVWLASKNDPEKALSQYKQALSVGGSRPLPELFSTAGIKFDFSQSTMVEVINAVKDELDALPI